MVDFDGTVQSDFLKKVDLTVDEKSKILNFTQSDFTSLRENLIEYIKAVYPLDYQNFSESDLGMVFIELVAYMGAVLSMKADMLAHENFIGTAKQTDSVKKLLELLGIRMKGPIGSTASCKLTLNQNPGFDDTNYFTIPLNARSMSVVSPIDGAPLTYTLYKVVNGTYDIANSTGDILLYKSEADNTSNPVTFSNLVLVEGNLVTDSGNFINTDEVKSIRLTESPVIEGSTNVFVETVNSTASGVYQEVDNVFFASGSTHKVYQIDYDDEYGANLTFGDNVLGSRPDNNANYLVTYRVGGGLRGNIPLGALNIINTFSHITNSNIVVDGVFENISTAVGGQEAETIEHAKKYGPLVFRSQDRLVTLQDYNTFVNTFVGATGATGKGFTSTREGYNSANTIDVYILEKASELQFSRSSSAFKLELLNAIAEKKMITDEIVINDGLIRTIDLVLTCTIDRKFSPVEERIKQKIRSKVFQYMGTENAQFGSPFVRGKLLKAIHELDEVLGTSIDNIDSDLRIGPNEIVQLNNLIINVELL
tara:strand:- start:7231 stop:8841 length:1611 start_codon:yes stop_codon:yes gene_type:complete